MANYRAITNGNWSDLAIWQDDSLGYFTASSVLPTSADDVYSNNFTVTIDGTRNANTIRNTAFTPPTNLGAMSIPQMTSNTTPSGVAAASSGGSVAWQAFDRNTGTAWTTSGGITTGWLSYQFTSGKIIKRYGFFTNTNSNTNPRTWTFEGSNNGSTWTTLDTQTNFVTGPSTFYSFDISSNVTSYTYYRINITVTQGGGGNIPAINSLEMSEITNLYEGIVAGGGFTFANGGDLTCTASNAIEVGSTTPVLLFNLPVGQNATFRGNVTSIANVSNYNSIRVANSGTLNLIGNYTLSNGNTANRAIISVTSNSVLNIVGNIASNQTSTQISNQTGNTLWITGSGAIVNITGNVSGSSTNSFLAAYQTIYATVGCTINITGNITTNSSPSIWLNAGGTLNVIGNITGGNDYPAIYNINAPATIDLLGVTTSGSGYPAVQGLATTFVKVRGNVVNTDTYCAIYAGRVTIDNNVTSWQFKDSTNTVTRTLYTAGVALGNPATTNVRSGVTYGASNELTGTASIPLASQTLLGVPVDNTTGTLLMTPQQFWDYLISSGFASGSIGDRLQNASTVETTGQQIASYNI